jgi:aspartate carbamoyltransferase catalytic subunit
MPKVEEMHLIALEDLDPQRTRDLLALGLDFLGSDSEVITPTTYQTALTGKAIALLFFEPSTRTRISFELAAKRLGAIVTRLEETGSSLEKGETILDTARNLHSMGIDAFVIRHAERDTPYLLAEHMPIPIINAGNGSGEHPSQGLLDALCLVRALGDGEVSLQGRRIAIVGDIVRSRVARSDVHVLEKLGASVTLAGPAQMLPAKEAPGWGNASMVTSRDEAIEGADAVIVLRIQRERMQGASIDTDRYIEEWQIRQEVIDDLLPEHARIMHPGPVNRGVELTSDVADGPRSLILEQVRCGVAIRQAILARLVGGR